MTFIITGSFLSPFIFIVLILFIRTKRPEWKGRHSEELVHQEVLELPDEYNVFSNLLFESNGRSTQIDHVIVSPYGVFVIETKGYKGWILGGEHSEYWTQIIYKSKHQFYNPIKQNEGHIRFLRYLLKCHIIIPFIPIVVFNNNAELKVYVENHIVVNRSDLNQVISQYRKPVLTQEQVDWIVQTIHKHYTDAGKEETERHKDNAKRQQYRTRSLIERGICPQCGGQLVLRNGKYGQFYGCKNYPQCKFTIGT